MAQKTIDWLVGKKSGKAASKLDFNLIRQTMRQVEWMAASMACGQIGAWRRSGCWLLVAWLPPTDEEEEEEDIFAWCAHQNGGKHAKCRRGMSGN